MKLPNRGLPFRRAITVAALALVTGVPAAAGDALQTLYGLSAGNGAEKTGETTKAGAVARFGQYGPRSTAIPGPVRTVMHVHRTPDGRVLIRCSIDHVAQPDVAADERIPPRRAR